MRSPLKIEIESVCQPSSVVYGHLSRLIVTNKLERYSRCFVGRTALLTDTQSCSEWGLHGILCYHNIGELLPRLSILTARGLPNGQSRQKSSRLRRFISVALSLKSPSPDVIRHPVLCCSDFPHGHTTPRPYNKLNLFLLYHNSPKKSPNFPCFFLKSGV